MDFSEIRPILSGLAGGLLATLLYSAWAKWLPQRHNGKSANNLVLQHRLGIKLANAAFFFGLGIMFAMYAWGGYSRNDWRPFCIGVGFAFAAPLIVVPAVALVRACSPTEAFVAFALQQRTPVFVLLPLLMLGVPMMVFGLVSL